MVFSGIAEAFVPVLLYECGAALVSMAAGGILGASGRSVLLNLCAIPAAALLYRKEYRKREGGSAGGLLFACILGAAGNRFFTQLFDALRLAEAFSDAAQEALLSGENVFLFLGPGLLAPVGEELIFRGLCYGRLRNRMGVLPAALLCALLFAAVHGNVIQALYAFPMGLAACLLTEKNGLKSAVAFHLSANLCTLLIGMI